MGYFLWGDIFNKKKKKAIYNELYLFTISYALGLLEGCNLSVLSQCGTVKSGTFEICVILNK